MAIHPQCKPGGGHANRYRCLRDVSETFCRGNLIVANDHACVVFAVRKGAVVLDSFAGYGNQLLQMADLLMLGESLLLIYGDGDDLIVQQTCAREAV